MNLATPAPAQTRAPVNTLNRANPLLYIVLIAVGVIALAPFVWMLLSSIKSFGDFSFVDFSNLKNIGRSFWPWPPFGDSAPAFGNFAEAMDRIDRSSDYRVTSPNIPPQIIAFASPKIPPETVIAQMLASSASISRRSATTSS